ncbi:hypothetical protein LCGC14_3137560, partial [marine sediment metagenome]
PYARTYDPSESDKADLLALCRDYAPPHPIQGPVLLGALFRMPLPKGAPKYIRKVVEATDKYAMSEYTISVLMDCLNEGPLSKVLHTKRPDVDNLVKLVKDALNGIYWKDDSQVQITAAIIPRSLLEQDWGEPLYMEEDDIVAEHIGMLECAFSELGDQRGIDYLKAMTVYAKGKRGNNISETRHGKFFGYRSKTILPADFFERNLDSQLVVLLQESYVAETEDSTEGLAHKYGADSLRKIKGTMCYAAYNRARETE